MKTGLMGRVDLLLVGGSHLASPGLPPTANFAVLVGRRLRRALKGRFGRPRLLFHEGAPSDIPGLLPDPLPEGAIVVVLPRNLALAPMLGELRQAAARLRRGRPLEFRSAFLPRSGAAELLRRARLLARAMAGTAYAVMCLPLLPGRLERYGRELDAAVAEIRRRGAGLVVLATPIPLDGAAFPLSRFYQARFARLIRSRRGPGVEIADLFRILTPEHLQPRDPLHLTAEGHRRVGDALWEAVAR
jgi:hypothetical protein